MELLYQGNDARASVLLRDERNGDPIVAGAVRLTARDSAGRPLTGMQWPLTLVHEGGGKWSTPLSHSLNVQHNRQYVFDVEVSIEDIVQRYAFSVQGKKRDG